MIKVKVIDPQLTVKLQDPKMTLVPGTVYELSDDIAKKLLESNFVTEVKEEQNGTAEKFLE